MSEFAKFGPGGNSEAFYDAGFKSSADAPAWLKSIGLDAYEYQAGNGLTAGPKALTAIGEAAKAAGIQMSIHAPYFISLSGVVPEKRLGSIRYIRDSLTAGELLGAYLTVVHTGSAAKISRREAVELAKDTLSHLLDEVSDNGILIGLETMGKINQLGDLDEVLELCTLDARLVPCIDFGHLYARSLGADDGAEAFRNMLSRVEEILGGERASRFHSHFSHIQFTPNGGEKCHRTFADDDGYGPDWSPLAAEIARRGWCPTFICESAGTQAEDAGEMKRIYLQNLK